jgi:sugar lactone lactonase YvrE
MGALIAGLWFSASALNAQRYMVETVAGAADQDHALGDGAPAVSEVLAPYGLTVDPTGTLYIADRDHNRIRKVGVDGSISTLAGVRGDPRSMGFDNGGGYSGDGGPAGTARLNRPIGLALDRQGNLYIADSDNNCIRRVTPQGIISTVAGQQSSGFGGDGGPATQARMAGPEGVAVDGAGNLFIADTRNRRVRKVTPDGRISTVAGRGCDVRSAIRSAELAQACVEPNGIAVGADGHLYVAERDPGRISRISAAGVVSPIAGAGDRGMAGDGVPALQAKLDRPTNVAADADGNVFILEARGLRMVRSDGVITTIAPVTPVTPAGTGVTYTGLATAPSGRLYAADRWPTGTGRVRRLTPAGARGQTLATAAELGVTAESLRIRALVAMETNLRKYRDVLFNASNWAEFRGQDENLRRLTPRARFHREAIGKAAELALLFDGWDDRPPPRISPEKRVLPGNGLRDADWVEHLLQAHHTFSLDGSAMDGGRRAWILEATPADQTDERGLSPTERCVAGLRATLWIDSGTAFPIRADMTVVRPGKCSVPGTPNSVHDSPGTTEQAHFQLVRAKDQCGTDDREIWLLDQSETIGRIGVQEYRHFWGWPIAERSWLLGPSYAGGIVRVMTVLRDPRIYFTSSCIAYTGAEAPRLVESVDSTITFSLPDANPREPGPPSH